MKGIYRQVSFCGVNAIGCGDVSEIQTKVSGSWLVRWLWLQERTLDASTEACKSALGLKSQQPTFETCRGLS